MNTNEQHIGPYQQDIMNQLGCSADDAAMVEDIMRNDVFHSTLDWVTDAQFRHGAKKAWAILEADRDAFEDYYRKARQAFHELKRANESK